MSDTNTTDKKRQERRRASRMPYGADAAYRNASLEGTGTVRDISSEGLFLEAENVPAAGDPVVIDFQLRHSNHHIQIPAVVAWCTASGMGIRFQWR